MKYKTTAGTTSFIARVFVNDYNSIYGLGLSGVLYNSPGFSGYYSRVGDSAPTAISFVTATPGTFTSGGWIAIDNVKMQGTYEFGIPNAALAAGSPRVNIQLFGANGMVPVLMEIELDKIDYQSSVTDAVWNANLSVYPSGNTAGSGLYCLAQHVYYADIELVQNTAGAQDDYGVQWFRNALPLNSGQISNPAYSVYNTITGAALLTDRTLNYTSSYLGMLSRTETTLTSSGIPYLVIASGTIDNAVRQWANIVGKI